MGKKIKEAFSNAKDWLGTSEGELGIVKLVVFTLVTIIFNIFIRTGETANPELFYLLIMFVVFILVRVRIDGEMSNMFNSYDKLANLEKITIPWITLSIVSYVGISMLILYVFMALTNFEQTTISIIFLCYIFLDFVLSCFSETWSDLRYCYRFRLIRKILTNCAEKKKGQSL